MGYVNFTGGNDRGWLEDEFPLVSPYFRGRTVSFREGIFQSIPSSNHPVSGADSLLVSGRRFLRVSG